jgi:hypothetical protein
MIALATDSGWMTDIIARDAQEVEPDQNHLGC